MVSAAGKRRLAGRIKKLLQREAFTVNALGARNIAQVTDAVGA
jgi:dTDP-4-dehydrorhamnose reductase